MKLFANLPSEVRQLTVVSFFVSLGYSIQAPALPVFAHELGAGSGVVGIMVAVFALVRMTAAWPIGKTISRIGERRIMAGGMAIVAVTSFLAGLSEAPWHLILLRGLGGFGSAAFSVASMNLLLRKAPKEARGRAISIFMGGLNLGLVVGPTIGGALLMFSPRAVFFIYSALVAITGATSLRVLTEKEDGSGGGASASSATIGVGEAFRSSLFRAAISANFSLGWCVYGLRSSLLPLIVINLLHERPYWIGVGLTFCSLLQIAVLPTAGRLIDRWGQKLPLLIGSAMLVGGLLVLLSWPTLVSYFVCFGFMGLGAALSTTSASAAVGEVVRGQGGPVVAAFQMSLDFGMIVGPLVMGFIAETSFQLSLLVTAAIAALAVATAAMAPGRRRTAEQQPA